VGWSTVSERKTNSRNHQNKKRRHSLYWFPSWKETQSEVSGSPKGRGAGRQKIAFFWRTARGDEEKELKKIPILRTG